MKTVERGEFLLSCFLDAEGIGSSHPNRMAQANSDDRGREEALLTLRGAGEKVPASCFRAHCHPVMTLSAEKKTGVHQEKSKGSGASPGVLA